MEGLDWLAIASGVVGVIALLATVKWTQTKGLLKETAEALTTLSNAIEDNRITREEWQSILKECGDVVKAAAILKRR